SDEHPAPSSTAAVAAPTPVALARPDVKPSPVHAPRPKAPVLPLAAAAEPPPKLIDPPRLIGKDTIAQLRLDQGPSRGPADAPVTIIVFQDVLCKYCSKVLETLDELWADYPGQLRLVVKQFPVHEQARLAAEASLAADAQGKFWELHDVMMANQQDLSHDAIIAYAQQAGLDVASLTTALDQHTYAGALETEVKAATDVGIKATPTFLINGREVRGAVPANIFRDAIDQALAAAGS
ncbi:MAG TPA: thioredoxin domain-containing protein, partial [Kofleriaceae bacterium]|nr:thioredoxin domain-containing protein [Kofleriaceae bacterium]